MTKTERFPQGSIELRKHAAVCLALGMARGALFDALTGNLDDAKKILDGTATSELAKALGCTEGELAIDWNDHLTPAEIERIKGV